MNSNKTYDVQNDILSVHFNYGRGDLLEATEAIYYSATRKAENILAKYLVRRFLATHNADEITKQIDINKILAGSLKIHANFE